MKDLAKLKKAELLTIAFKKGLATEVDGTNTKAQIIAAIDLDAIDTPTDQPQPEAPSNADNYRESQNIDTRVLTDTELLRIIAKDKGSNPYRKFKYIKMFEDLNPGFKWRTSSPTSRLTYMQNLAHYQQYKDTPK